MRSGQSEFSLQGRESPNSSLLWQSWEASHLWWWKEPWRIWGRLRRRKQSSVGTGRRSIQVTPVRTSNAQKTDVFEQGSAGVNQRELHLQKMNCRFESKCEWLSLSLTHPLPHTLTHSLSLTHSLTRSLTVGFRKHENNHLWFWSFLTGLKNRFSFKNTFYWRKYIKIQWKFSHWGKVSNDTSYSEYLEVLQELGSDRFVSMIFNQKGISQDFEKKSSVRYRCNMWNAQYSVTSLGGGGRVKLEVRTSVTYFTRRF